MELSLYTCTNYERFVQEADDLQSNLAEAGIKLKIVPTDYFLEDAETFDNDDPDMCFDSCAMAPTGNQAYFANIQFATNGSSNLGNYSNAEVDALIKTLNATQDTDKRNELARQICPSRCSTTRPSSSLRTGCMCGCPQGSDRIGCWPHRNTIS